MKKALDSSLTLGFNYLPNNSIGSAHSNDNLNVAKMYWNFFSDRVENKEGKGENAGDQHFPLFQQCFQNASLSELLKLEIVM